MPDKPFFMYFAPGATHAPHHAPKEWSDKYQGRFDAGWDALREEIFARQKALGVIPADAELTARPEEIPAWDDMPDELKPVLARQMEVYAGFLEHTDHHVGPADRRARGARRARRHPRLLHRRRQRRDRPRARSTARSTRCFIFNGAAALETAEFMASKRRRVRRPEGLQPLRRRLGARDGHAVPVDEAGRLALGRHPQRHDRPLAQRLRGAWRDPLPVPPRDRRRPDRARSGRPARADVRARRQQMPMEGDEHGLLVRRGATRPSATNSSTSRCSATAASTTRAGPRSRATARHGWSRRAPSDRRRRVGALRHPTTGPRRATSPASMPAKLAELQRLFLIEARKYNVFPLDDRRVERFNADLAGRPELVKGNTQLLFGGMGRLTENSVLNIKNKSHAVTAEITVPEGGAEGRDHRPGRRLRGLEPLRQGRQAEVLLQPARPAALHDRGRRCRSRPERTRCAMEFAYDGGGLAKGGTVTLYVDGDKVGEGRVDGDRADDLLGRRDGRRRRDTASPVSDDYRARAASSPARSTGCTAPS